MKIKIEDVKRHGSFIRLGQGRTAIEGSEGNMPTLCIRDHGKQIKKYRGSSLSLSSPGLTGEDKEYLAHLGSD